MAKVARLGDEISHGGNITSASPNTWANGIKVARLNDTVHCNIHGDQTITSASTKAFANTRGIARLGDSISCGAVISTASPNVWAG